MSVLSAKAVPTEALPIIDVSGLRSPERRDREAVGAALRAACLDKGFFYITNHGIPAALQRRVFAEAERFFALPEAAKLAVHKDKSIANRGFHPMRNQTLEAGTPPDVKEGYTIGVHRDVDDPRVVARKFQTGPNQWPDLPGFRETMEEYFAAMFALELVMWRGLALSLLLEESYFDGFLDDAFAQLRLLHYPPQPANPLPDEKGCGAHTDFTGLTLLLQDDAGGLQVHDGDRGWIHAPPIPGTYICNLGDLIGRWTNGRYRSTIHRVVNLSGRDRYSIPFFFSGNLDYVVSCLPGYHSAEDPPKHPPVTVTEHLIQCFQRTYK